MLKAPTLNPQWDFQSGTDFLARFFDLPTTTTTTTSQYQTNPYSHFLEVDFANRFPNKVHHRARLPEMEINADVTYVTTNHPVPPVLRLRKEGDISLRENKLPLR